MAKVVVIAIHPQEKEILRTLLKQEGHEVFVAPPSAGNYIQFMQFRPHIVMIELSSRPIDQLASIRLLKKNKTLGKTPVLCYGPAVDLSTRSMYMGSGAGKYLERPLKVAILLDQLKSLCPEMAKPVESLTSKREKLKTEELARLLEPQAPPNEKLDILVRHVGKLMAFPFTVTRALQVTGDESSGAGDLAKVIAADSAICSTVLKLANSIHFGSQREVRNPKDAVIRIGFSETRNIVIGLGILDLLGKNEQSFGYSRQAFWYYSVARGLTAERLAVNAGWRESTLAFLGGLLSGFGILLLDEFFPDIFEKIATYVAREGVETSEACRAVLGVDHREFSVRLLEEWRLPRDMTQAMRNEVGALDVEPGSATRILELALALSAPIVRQMGVGRGLDSFVYPVADERMQEMRLPVGVGPAFLDPIASGVRLFASFLGLDPAEGPRMEPDLERPKVGLVRIGRKLLRPHIGYLERLVELVPVEPRNLAEWLKGPEALPIVILDLADPSLYEERNEVVATLASAPELRGIAFGEQSEVQGLSLPPGMQRCSTTLDLARVDAVMESLVGTPA